MLCLWDSPTSAVCIVEELLSTCVSPLLRTAPQTTPTHTFSRTPKKSSSPSLSHTRLHSTLNRNRHRHTDSRHDDTRPHTPRDSPPPRRRPSHESHPARQTVCPTTMSAQTLRPQEPFSMVHSQWSDVHRSRKSALSRRCWCCSALLSAACNPWMSRGVGRMPYVTRSPPHQTQLPRNHSLALLQAALHLPLVLAVVLQLSWMPLPRLFNAAAPPESPVTR